MFTDLQSYLKRPSLYEWTEEQFWNDPYIASQMLPFHLDPNTDAASRKPEVITCCAGWVASLLPDGASLLDIGCGPGLYTEQFAKRGLRVTGLDFSENSIVYARKNDPKSEYILQDYFTMDFDSSFDMITLIYYDYGTFIPEERKELLRRISKALKPGGLFLFDVYTPLRSKGKGDSSSWYVSMEGGFWSPMPHICLSAQNYYADTAEGCRHVIIEEDAVRCYNIWECYFTRQMLLDETAPFGFSEYGLYSDITGTPYSEDSESMCAVLRKDVN
jgi:SAM-dependent methyltransferase